MDKMVLLIIDVQAALLADGPWQAEALLANLRRLIDAAEECGVETVYVQHDGGKGDELEKGTPGWRLAPEIAPRKGEKVFDKCYNSAFKETGLDEYLQSRGIHTILMAGMQTEFCVDTTCRVAFEKGYSVLIPRGGTTTYDNPYMTGKTMCDYYEKIWNHRFAEVLSVEEAVERMKGKGERI